MKSYNYGRGIVPGGAPPDFGRSVNPISTRRDRLCPTLAPPDLQTFLRPCDWWKTVISVMGEHIIDLYITETHTTETGNLSLITIGTLHY